MMARQRGGPFIQLIRHHMMAAEMSYNANDGYNAISNLRCAAVLVKAELPKEPAVSNPYLYPIENRKLKMWFVKHKPAIATAVRKYIDTYGGGDISLADDDDDSGEDDNQ